MAKVVVRKKRTMRKLRLEALATLLFLFSVIASIGSNLFVRSNNVSLMIRIQDMQNECENYRLENKTLETDIRNLMNKERIISEANKNGLRQIQANFISIPNE